MSRFAALALGLALAAQPLAAAAQSMDINTVVSSIGGGAFFDAVEHVHSAASVRVIRLSSLAGASRSAAWVGAAVNAKAGAIARLQRELVWNPFAISVMRYNHVDVRQIIAIHRSGDGAVVLYADDL